MKAVLELTGEELVMLYISTGNASAGALIRQCIALEREFNGPMKAIAQSVTRQRKP